MARDGRKAAISKLPAELVRRLNPRRRELIRPVLDRPRDFVLLSARKLAAAVGSDAMTVLRTIRGMGFEGYPEFRRYLHELALIQTTQIDPSQGPLARGSDLSGHLRDSVSQDVANVAALRDSLEFGRLEALAARMYEARRIVLIAGDAASVLVEFLQHNLAIIDLPAMACTRAGHVGHVTRTLTRSDVVIAFTFRRGLRQTVEGLQQARARGAYCVGITDTHLSPLARFAQEYFVIPIEGMVYGVSYVAPMAFVNALVAACATSRRGRALRLLEAANEEQRTGFRWYRDGDLPAEPPAATARQQPPRVGLAIRRSGDRRSPPPRRRPDSGT